MERLKAITADTLVPISAIVVLLGGVVWLTSLHDTVSASEARLAVVESSQNESAKNFQEIRERLIRIEENLKNGPKR